MTSSPARRPFRLALALGAAALLLGSAAAAPAGSVPLPPPPAARPDLRVPPPPALHAAQTRCERCHRTDQWGDVAFAHERTGFPLLGEHRKVGCKQCHPVAFDRPVPHGCGTCHTDVHRGQLGFRCQGCHDEQSWKSRFDADAHRRVGFPLNGRHAFVSCEQCHGDALGRGFLRPAARCYDCHASDFARGNLMLAGHSRFSTDCQQCHAAFRFKNPFFPDHQRCFDIAGGPHAGIGCQTCHTPGAITSAAMGTCSGTGFDCKQCHFRGSATCSAHHDVDGLPFPSMNCVDRRCYECHRFSSAVGALKGRRAR